MGARRQRRGERGLTLLELIIVIGVLVMMLGLGLNGLSGLSSTQLRTQTNRLAAAVRHVYNRSVATGLYMRLVLDVSSDSYWVEASPTPVFINPKRDPDEDEQDDESSAKVDPDDPEAKRKAKARPRFQMDDVIDKVTMERGIKIDSVLIGGRDFPVNGGKAYVHFFPNGYAEPAMIYTSDGEESFYTLVVNPLTGKVTRQPGKVDPDTSFGRPDKVEEEGR